MFPTQGIPAVRILAQVAQPSTNRSSAKSQPTSRPEQDWEKFFASGQVQPETIRQLVAELSESRRSNDVIGLLEQAIIEGQGQPWMYEVLALTMEIAGRPRADIERVLLSSRDVTPPDTESLLFLAAYLARFQRFEHAIRCCRQAAEIESNRPEPYASALRYARRIGDVDTLTWATLGVLTYAWGPDQRALRDEAREEVPNVRQQLKSAERWGDLATYETSISQAERVDLRIRVEWTGAGDLDLEVTEPQGSLCDREHRYSPGGGILLHDGSGPIAANCHDEYACPIAWSGEYRIKVIHSWGNIVGKRANVTVTRAVGDREVQREQIPVAITAEGTVVRVMLRNGRRTDAAAAKPVSQRREKVPSRSGSILSQLTPANQAGGGNQPFATGGGGGVGYQPVVQFLNEGVTLGAMATVSGDRRYVRLQVAPVFSSITDVFTFSFQQ